MKEFIKTVFAVHPQPREYDPNEDRVDQEFKEDVDELLQKFHTGKTLSVSSCAVDLVYCLRPECLELGRLPCFFLFEDKCKLV